MTETTNLSREQLRKIEADLEVHPENWVNYIFAFGFPEPENETPKRKKIKPQSNDLHRFISDMMLDRKKRNPSKDKRFVHSYKVNEARIIHFEHSNKTTTLVVR